MDDLNYFLPGQVWKYDNREGEAASTITVLKIDELDNDAVIHIRIDNIVIGNELEYLPHLPFSAEAIMTSITGFVKHLDALPEFEEGYKYWRKQFNAGEAGYWKIPLKEAIEAISHLLNKKEKDE